MNTPFAPGIDCAHETGEQTSHTGPGDPLSGLDAGTLSHHLRLAIVKVPRLHGFKVHDEKGEAREGDVVKFMSPAGLREIEIIEINYS